MNQPGFWNGFLTGFITAGVLGFILGQIRWALARGGAFWRRQVVSVPTDRTPWQVFLASLAAFIEFFFWLGVMGAIGWLVYEFLL